MFEWLENEISQVRTPQFHMVDGPANANLRKAVIESNLPLPPSFKEFVLKFGNAKLYRNAPNGSYRIGVFAGPRDAILNDETHVFHLGFHDGAKIYVKPVSYLAELPIFEFEEEEEKVADNFEEWLIVSCASARKSYGNEKWAEIMRGPEPFTVEEQELIEARRRILWRVLGIDAARNRIFEVTNTGIRALPVLTVGIRSKDGRLNGAVLLKIGHIGPGQTAILHIDCYKDLMPPAEIEAFSLPDPQPEDRERYEELANKSKSAAPIESSEKSTSETPGGKRFDDGSELAAQQALVRH